jgi:N-acetylneuraminic acid mutarotase
VEDPVKPLLLALILCAAFSVSGCSSSSSSGNPPPPATYTIGGTVSGLAGTGLVLQDNGGNNLSIGSDGNFIFTTPLNGGATYAVTVSTQPSSPTQTCNVANGSGTANANVSNVQVACATAQYTIGGTISGLVGSGLVLQDNGGDNLSVTGNGSFTFATQVSSGGAYAVTVFTQPTNPAQTCAVTDSSGNASANVTAVQVVCVTNAVPGTWIWIDGADVVNQTGVYGTKGTALPTNIPGARDSAASWTDSAGNFWLFGGNGYVNDSEFGEMNDLWKYSSGEWSWVSGAAATNTSGVYGAQGVASVSNSPGARSEAVSSLDASGNLWLFGGKGVDSVGGQGDLNDLWKYSSGQWTWVSGSNVVSQPGNYGTLGLAALTNIPGARHHAVSWIDQSGNFWLFGGVGYDSNGNYSTLNDLWEYSAGQWTWVNGSETINAIGAYGIKGTAASSNVPGARSAGVAWQDASGNFWLFGGGGYDSAGVLGYLNDLWMWSAGEWIWMGGSNVSGENGTYGTEGTPATNNIPGGRIQATTWTDAAGNFWLYGGYGLAVSPYEGQLSDLWVYSSGEWTWVSGSSLGNQIGNYGTIGVPASTNVPGARQANAVWVDSVGIFWIFGGFGDDSQGTSGELNDLWEYQPVISSQDQRLSRRASANR